MVLNTQHLISFSKVFDFLNKLSSEISNNKKKEKPSEIYLEVGFEDLSHFSFIFKNQYGISTSNMTNP